jgi:hypothetical protein
VARKHGTPSNASCPERAGAVKRSVALPNDKVVRLYAAAVQEKKVQTYKLTVRSRGAHPPGSIKQLLKAKINPSEIKVAINTFTTLNSGRIIIKTNSK